MIHNKTFYLNFLEDFSYASGRIGNGSDTQDGVSINKLGGIIYVTIDGKIGRYELTAGHSAIDCEEGETTSASNSSNDLEIEFDADSDDIRVWSGRGDDELICPVAYFC